MRATRLTSIFSPMTALDSSTSSWTVRPSASVLFSSASASPTLAAMAWSRICSARAMNRSLLATKSVSQRTSTRVPTPFSALAATRPFEVVRPSRLVTPFWPLTRRISAALAWSPSASSRAFLTSSMPAPVCSRRVLMSATVKFAISLALLVPWWVRSGQARSWSAGDAAAGRPGVCGSGLSRFLGLLVGLLGLLRPARPSRRPARPRPRRRGSRRRSASRCRRPPARSRRRQRLRLVGDVGLGRDVGDDLGGRRDLGATSVASAAAASA